MSKPYTIRAGDTLTHIAAREGFPSWRDIYHHPDNLAFRVKRPNPDRIFPGDVLIIPDKGRGPTGPQSKSFSLHIISNFALRHEPRVFIVPVNGSRVFELATYRFHPKSLADAIETKLGGGDRHSPAVRASFRTPAPAAAGDFGGAAAFMQILFEPDPPMCRLFLRATSGIGLQNVVHADFVADRGSPAVMPAHGELVLLDDNFNDVRDPRMAALAFG
jgi:hypothetical protein